MGKSTYKQKNFCRLLEGSPDGEDAVVLYSCPGTPEAYEPYFYGKLLYLGKLYKDLGMYPRILEMSSTDAKMCINNFLDRAEKLKAFA